MQEVLQCVSFWLAAQPIPTTGTPIANLKCHNQNQVARHTLLHIRQRPK